MQLIYRGHIYHYTPTAPKPYFKPRALNWRYQSPGERYETTFIPQPDAKSHALNWRYRLAAGL